MKNSTRKQADSLIYFMTPNAYEINVIIFANVKKGEGPVSQTTVPTFNSCTKCVGSLCRTHNRKMVWVNKVKSTELINLWAKHT